MLQTPCMPWHLVSCAQSQFVYSHTVRLDICIHIHLCILRLHWALWAPLSKPIVFWTFIHSHRSSASALLQMPVVRSLHVCMPFPRSLMRGHHCCVQLVVMHASSPHMGTRHWILVLSCNSCRLYHLRVQPVGMLLPLTTVSVSRS